MTNSRQFTAIAMALEGTLSAPHFERTAFKVRRTYATLAADGLSANLKFMPDAQEFKVMMAPEVFAPVPGGWGRQGWTTVQLAAVEEAELRAALEMAWRHATGPARRRRRLEDERRHLQADAPCGCNASTGATPMQIDFAADATVRKAIADIGRTEDVHFSPSNTKLAVAGFKHNPILVLSIRISRGSVEIDHAVTVQCRDFSFPHGVFWLSETRLAVANRGRAPAIVDVPVARGAGAA